MAEVQQSNNITIYRILGAYFSCHYDSDIFTQHCDAATGLPVFLAFQQPIYVYISLIQIQLIFVCIFDGKFFKNHHLLVFLLFLMWVDVLAAVMYENAMLAFLKASSWLILFYVFIITQASSWSEMKTRNINLYFTVAKNLGLSNFSVKGSRNKHQFTKTLTKIIYMPRLGLTDVQHWTCAIWYPCLFYLGQR